LLQLTFGVSFWPPRLELPFLPEIPWSSSVDTPIVEAPRADQCIWLMDASWMSIVVGEEGLPEKASYVIEYAAAGSWTWLEYEWVAPDAAAPQGSLRIHERAHASGVTTESTRTIPWEPSGTAIHDSDFEGRRVKIVLTRLENGRFKPDVDVEEP
jgi:hypothetical protein